MGKMGRSGQSGLRVMGQSSHGSIGLRVGLGLPVFSNKFFFKKIIKTNQ